MADNSFGTLFRFTTFGESHGPAIGCVVDCGYHVVGMKAVDAPDISVDQPHG